jgi:hypothetical protein
MIPPLSFDVMIHLSLRPARGVVKAPRFHPAACTLGFDGAEVVDEMELARGIEPRTCA